MRKLRGLFEWHKILFMVDGAYNGVQEPLLTSYRLSPIIRVTTLCIGYLIVSAGRPKPAEFCLYKKVLPLIME